MGAPYSLQYVKQTPFGTLGAVALPAGLQSVPPEVIQTLEVETQALASALPGRRQIEFTGGRLAYQHVMQALGHAAPCLKSGERREPLAPAGWSVSITHKEDLALCLVAPAAQGSLGIDLEGDGRDRMRIAPRVLRPEELAEVEALPPSQQWPRVLLAFAVKEATYKAIHPHLQRYVGFEEARVTLDAAGAPGVTLLAREGEPRLTLESAVEHFEGRVLAMVRARVVRATS